MFCLYFLLGYTKIEVKYMTYDTIVIGAGHNGLVSALRLAGKGKKVLVLEKADRAGGAAKSGELTELGFIRDFYAMNIRLAQQHGLPVDETLLQVCYLEIK